MHFEDMAAAIGRAHGAALDEITRTLWAALAAGQISEGQAGRLSEAADARRRTIEPRPAPGPQLLARSSIFKPRRSQRSPDRVASTLRRRTLAASGPMPPSLAGGFTTTEMAVLRVVADDVRETEACELSLAEIAARAGCCRTSAQTAIRTARMMGLLTVEARPRQGKTNLTNVIRIISAEWSAWLIRGTRRAHPPGSKSVNPTDKQREERGFRGAEGRPFSPSKRGRCAPHRASTPSPGPQGPFSPVAACGSPSSSSIGS